MRVAFATRDGERVDAELRSAPRLDVYEVTAAGARLERTCTLEDVRSGGGARIEALAGVELVYVSAIGPSAAARLASHGIRAATSLGGARIDALLAALRGSLPERAR